MRKVNHLEDFNDINRGEVNDNIRQNFNYNMWIILHINKLYTLGYNKGIF